MTESNEPEITFFAKQERIYPKRVWGRYRKLKWVAMVITLGIYYLAPFIRWDRGPNAPDQAILIDLPNRRAYWFFIEIWPQEVYFLTGILILAAVALFFVTSLFGRVWCGYFCPQTVWTDLFVWVERIVQGDRNKRKKLREGPWTFEKLWKMAATHFLWLVIAWVTAGSFVLYFNDAPTLVWSFFELNVSSTVLAFIAGLTFSTYVMAGFAREQVCIYMCPYARFQSAMFDSDTLIIGYDEVRGEKRGKHKKGEPWDGRGHCVDCTACVQVCPMGIDIRDGLQMECIACGLCVDACNNIMDKVELPRGLIRYDTERRMSLPEAERSKKVVHLMRPRTFYYVVILALVGGVMLYALITRAPQELHVLHDRNPLFVALSDGSIRNGYVLKILNKTHDHRRYSVSVEGLENVVLEIQGAGDIQPENLYVEADSVGSFHITVSAAVEAGPPVPVTFILIDKQSGERSVYESIFVSERG
ncbi:MAG: cytochrome c oxidase accessory protein CcoG [Alphaproteobacteria bacterium]|nr:cytochrome c oxidase accessory protein CcoG [Alphaproteobacteria bacterium]MCB9975157.1 cytochrome c oxidase accessory protein CcoG [Rhodospirillales bacterium]